MWVPSQPFHLSDLTRTGDCADQAVVRSHDERWRPKRLELGLADQRPRTLQGAPLETRRRRPGRRGPARQLAPGIQQSQD